MTQFLYLDQKLGLLIRQRITRNDIGNAPVKPASNRGARDLQLGSNSAGLSPSLSERVVAAPEALGILTRQLNGYISINL